MPNIEIKWLLQEIENTGIDTEKKIWRLPHSSGPNYYSLKEIKPHIHSKNLYYRIHNKRYTKDRLNLLCILLKKPKIYHIPDKRKLPFT